MMTQDQHLALLLVIADQRIQIFNLSQQVKELEEAVTRMQPVQENSNGNAKPRVSAEASGDGRTE